LPTPSIVANDPLSGFHASGVPSLPQADPADWNSGTSLPERPAQQQQQAPQPAQQQQQQLLDPARAVAAQTTPIALGPLLLRMYVRPDFSALGRAGIGCANIGMQLVTAGWQLERQADLPSEVAGEAAVPAAVFRRALTADGVSAKVEISNGSLECRVWCLLEKVTEVTLGARLDGLGSILRMALGPYLQIQASEHCGDISQSAAGRYAAGPSRIRYSSEAGFTLG
jgi:hypothetical protein